MQMYSMAHVCRLAELPAPPPGKTGWPWTVETPPLSPARSDGSPWPRITIVTPSYNQGQFIEETIRSVLLQGYPDLEYIIIDGASTDNTVETIRKYEAHLAYWISESDKGQSDAINKGFARATGGLLNWLNSDDFFAPCALSKVGLAHAQLPAGVGVIVGQGHKIDQKRRAFYSPLPAAISRESLMRWCYGNNFMQPACFFTREAFEKAGPVRLDLHYSMDLALWCEIERHFKFQIMDETIAYAHTHADAKTTAQRKLMYGEVSLLLAGLPGGFEAGRTLLFDLLNGKLERKPTIQARARRLGGRISKALGLHK